MFYKKFEHYIIFCLLKQITMILYVSGKPTPTDSDKTKLFTKKQLEILGGSVCSELEINVLVLLVVRLSSFSLHVTSVKVLRTTSGIRKSHHPFYTEDEVDGGAINRPSVDKPSIGVYKIRLKPSPDISMHKRPSHVRIQCQINGNIRFQILSSDRYQLVALVPHLGNDSGTDNDIMYIIVDPKDENGTIYRKPRINYTLWSAILEEGSPVKWRGGEKVPEYKELTENRTYEIKESIRPSLDGSAVIGQFTWNTRGDNDLCFEVVNSCLKSDSGSTKIRLNSKDDEPQIKFEHLKAEDQCNITVTGSYGRKQFTYRTLPCTKIKCPPKEKGPKLEIPQNVTLVATEESSDTYKVYVDWLQPGLLPDSYTVNLVTGKYGNHTIVKLGNATEVVFQDVTGEGTYRVLIQARLGNTTANTSRYAKFPDIRHGEGNERGAGGAGGVGGAALGVGCAAAAALVLICRCRRRRLRVPVPPYKPQDDKPSKDGDTEVLEIWSETEDRWEVRADKLVLHEVIGEGAFGVVRRATLAPHSVQVAVKMLKDFPSLDEIRSFRSEMELMKSVGVHPHLVSLVGCCSGRRPLIVAEYCSRGDLLSYLRCTWDVMLSKRNAKYYNNNIDISDYRNDLFKCKAQMESSKLVVNKLYELQEICDKELTALDLLSFCRQIAMGMEFLAANRVVHRDLAARNILVTADRTLKIADFGLSRDVYEENQYKQKGNGKMPVKWMALESLTRRIYTTQSDVWSFGVVVWEIATVGGAPYASVPGARLPKLLRSGYRMPKPNNCSPQLYDIMLSCWRTYPRERPTFVELHQRLDELLNSACANQYLSLEIDADDAPPTPKHHRYIKMLMRGKRGWTRGETYERPLKAPHTNHYTTPPDSLSAHPV